MTASRQLAQTETGSAVPRRILGQHLRNLRQQACLTVKVAGTMLEWSEPKMWRIETGQTAMRVMDVEAMCAVYSAPPDVTRTLLELARQSKAQGWWHSYGEAVSEQASVYAMLEEAACGLRGYATCLVPPLLRTEAYARSLVKDGNRGARNNHFIRDGLARQSLVLRANAPLAVTFIFCESLVRRPVSGVRVMAEQLRHLAELAELPNVCLRVVPFGKGRHPGLKTGPFVLLEYPPSGGADFGEDIVYVDGLTGELFLDKPHEVREYRKAHTTMLGCSLGERATQDLLRAIAKKLDH